MFVIFAVIVALRNTRKANLVMNNITIMWIYVRYRAAVAYLVISSKKNWFRRRNVKDCNDSVRLYSDIGIDVPIRFGIAAPVVATVAATIAA